MKTASGLSIDSTETGLWKVKDPSEKQVAEIERTPQGIFYVRVLSHHKLSETVRLEIEAFIDGLPK